MPKAIGCHEYPDFGQYMLVNYFKVFCSAAPDCWSDPKYWYEYSHDILWDIFLPCLEDFNGKQQRLIKTFLMLVDESMSGWEQCFAMEWSVFLVCWLFRMWFKIQKCSQERLFMEKDHSWQINQTLQPIPQKCLDW